MMYYFTIYNLLFMYYFTIYDYIRQTKKERIPTSRLSESSFISLIS